MAWYRVANKAVILPAANSSSKSIYVPAHTKSAVFFGDHVYLPTQMISDVPIVFSSCIVEQTCGVLMVRSYFVSYTRFVGRLTFFQHSYSILIASWTKGCTNIWPQTPSSSVLSMQVLVSVSDNRYTQITQFNKCTSDTQEPSSLSSPITKPPTSLFVYCSNSLDLL